MAPKLTVPRPDPNRKVQRQEKEKKPPAETKTETEAETETKAEAETETETESAMVTLTDEVDITEPSGPPVLLIDPTPAPRPMVESLPSQYELESRRKSSPPVLARRKQLTKLVMGAVGVAWFICLCAIGETALRWVITSASGDTHADVRSAHR